MQEIVKVWVWVIIFKWDKILCGLRKNAHWEWTWWFLGWHLEFWESFEECAKREAMEEANIKIDNISFLTATNDFFEKDNKHYVSIFMKWEYKSWELKNNEEYKLDRWGWYTWDALPQPLMIPIENLIKKWFSPFNQ